MIISEMSPYTITIDESSVDPDKTSHIKSFIDILRPVIRINQIFGVCPLEISGHNIQLRFKSLKAIHTLCTLFILTGYFSYTLYQFICSFGRGRSVPEIVTMATWVAGTLIPMAMLVLAIMKREQFSHFFAKSNEFRGPLKGMIRCHRTLLYARKLFTIYIFLTFFSCLFVALDVIRNPTMDIFILAYTKNPSPALIAFSCVFQCYLVILRSCGCAFIEVLCCCIGASFQNTVTSIIDELHGVVGVSTTPVYRQHKSSVDQNNVLAGRRRQRRHAIADLRHHHHPHQHPLDYVNIDGINTTKRCGDDDLPSIPSVPKFFFAGVGDLVHSNNKYSNLEDSNKQSPNSTIDERHYVTPPGTPTPYSHEGAAPIIIAIKKFNCISSMQSLLNCIFGTILALDIGLLVLVSCLLLYLKINFLGSGSVHYIDGITFVGNCLLYFSRLIIVFISLSNVHEMSIHFNDCVTTSLMHVHNPQPPEINLVVAHLTSQFANPSCFNAAGFFIFSRGSLLAVLSAIMTYVIFLLQAKM